MKPKVWLYRHKESGESKGEATITYDDPNAAQSAISWFDNKKLNGAVIHVSLAQRQNTWQKGGGFRGGNRGGGGMLFIFSTNRVQFFTNMYKMSF